MPQWYISLDGQQQGPVSVEQVAELVLGGRLLLTDHVWREGMGDWSQLQYVEELMGYIRRLSRPSRRPAGPTPVSRPPAPQSYGQPGSQFPASQPRYSQRPAPQQSQPPQPVQSQRPEARQSFQPQSLQGYRSQPVKSQRPQAMQSAAGDKLDSYDSQSLARLASSPSIPPVAPAAVAAAAPPQAAVSQRPPRIDPEAEAVIRTPSVRPPHRVSERPAGAAEPRTSVPPARPPARASRTSLLLALASGIIIVGLAAASAVFILKPVKPAEPPAAGVAAAANPQPAEPPPTQEPAVQEQQGEEADESGEGDTPAEAEGEGEAPAEAEGEAHTFVFELDEQPDETEEVKGKAGPGASAAKGRARPRRTRFKKAKPAGKATATAGKSAPAAAETKPADTGKPETAGDDDPFAEPIKSGKSAPAEKPAETAAEKKKPPAPDPNRSIDDLLDEAITDKAKSKPAKPATTSASTSAEKPASVALPAEPSRAQILSAIRAVLPSAKACGRGAGGTAQSRITVAGSTGRAVDVKVSGVDAAVGNCIANALRKARFPKFSKPTFNVSYPIRL